MQTIAVQIQDNYVQNFLSYVRNHSEDIIITKDRNLEYDPYFYERQKELHKLREDIKNGDMEMLSQEQYDKEMKQFFSDLKK
jgi:5,10-methylenetetrahydrofolate reductase